MFRLFAVVAAAIAGAAIWRRREIRSDAKRATKALSDAAGSARSRIRPDSDSDSDADADLEAGATEGGDASEPDDGDAAADADVADSASSGS